MCKQSRLCPKTAKDVDDNPLFVPLKISASCAHTLAAVDNPPDPVRNLLLNLNTQKKAGNCTASQLAWRWHHYTEALVIFWGTKTASNALTRAESNYPSATTFFLRRFEGFLFFHAGPLAGGDFWKEEGVEKRAHESSMFR